MTERLYTNIEQVWKHGDFIVLKYTYSEEYTEEGMILTDGGVLYLLYNDAIPVLEFDSLKDAQDAVLGIF